MEYYKNMVLMKLTINGDECKIIPNNELNIVAAWELRVKYVGSNLLCEHGLKDWTMNCQRINSTALGLCNISNKTILINTPYLYILDYPTLKNLMLHEIAHVLVGIGHGHDDIWKAKAIEIGCNGQIIQGIKELVKVDEDNYKIML